MLATVHVAFARCLGQTEGTSILVEQKCLAYALVYEEGHIQAHRMRL